MFSRPGIFKWREINFAGKSVNMENGLMKEEAHMFLLFNIIKTIQVDNFFNGEALSWGENEIVKFLKIRLA